MIEADLCFKFSEPLEPYLGYMDKLLLPAISSSLIIGLDANALFLMLLSKAYVWMFGGRLKEGGDKVIII